MRGARQRAGRRVGRCVAAFLLAGCAVGAPAAPDACDAGALPAAAPTAMRFTPHTVPLAATVSVDGERRDVLLYFAAAPAAAGAAAMFVVADAATGAALWRAGVDTAPLLGAAVSAPPAGVLDARGLTYRAWAGDTGGGVWRIDLSSEAPAGWRLSRLADLSGLAEGPVTFPVPPDIVRGVDANGHPFDGIVLTALAGDGDDRRIDLVLLRDYAPGAEGPPEPLAIGNLADVDACGEGAAVCPPLTGPGWYRRGVARGDALSGSPLVDGGRVLIGSFRRSSLDCEAGVAVSFVAMVELASGLSLLRVPTGMELGRQLIEAPAVVEGGLYLPGLSGAVEELSLPSDLLQARGLAPRRLYWLDLLLDRD